jgi:hypothetical protein
MSVILIYSPLIKAQDFKKLNKNKISLSEEEREECFRRDAVWHYAMSKNPITGKKEMKVCAVWKSKDPKSGKITYVTNTQRAFQTSSTLKGAINLYHKVIKQTA